MTTTDASEAGDATDTEAIGPTLRTHLTRVVGARQVTAHVRRITFGGGDLTTFEPVACDQFLYVLLPPPGRAELTIDRSFTWEGYYGMAEADRPVGAYYTVRHHRPLVGEIDMDFVLHDDAGPASAWAARAEPGDPVALWGPRTTFTPPDGEVDWYLLVADETGLPGVGAILDALGPGASVRAVVEVAGSSEEQPLPTGERIDVTWCHRGDAPPGTTTALVDTVRSLDLPLGRGYVWGGGESRAMTGVRRHVRHELGMPRQRVSLTPFWRHDAHAADPEEAEDA